MSLSRVCHSHSSGERQLPCGEGPLTQSGLIARLTNTMEGPPECWKDLGTEWEAGRTQQAGPRRWLVNFKILLSSLPLPSSYWTDSYSPKDKLIRQVLQPNCKLNRNGTCEPTHSLDCFTWKYVICFWAINTQSSHSYLCGYQETLFTESHKEANYVCHKLNSINPKENE